MASLTNPTTLSTLTHHHHQPSSISTFTLFNSPKHPSFTPLITHSTITTNPTVFRRTPTITSATTNPSPSTSTASFHGTCYVVRDNIDTDQIIPAEYLTLVPSKPDEYKKLGSYALIGLPSSYEQRFVEPGENNSKYSIIIAGDNFGCGSSREHAPVALGAAGVAAVVAESYARIFFRNSVATGEVYPLESEVRVCDECRTGDVVTIELEGSLLVNHTTGKQYRLKPIGDAGPVIEAGGIFAYARKTGMIPGSLQVLVFCSFSAVLWTRIISKLHIQAC
ncbi:putative 3-isopropylmalate dehydratase [Helianthus annuus]|nr:putative 3-isopropylmalate dehydratase [Helianthus annuus]KAJ0499071.1 putative 3-isopropylmalate dehydratase [Helianthus annuus]KAJ0665085.1 putative 3-isopropylmalate dehydratase [Helianthus annuus]KAJ0672504.1 putative 3-isopropylmalate dehydratase [Helianthus annuus]